MVNPKYKKDDMLSMPGSKLKTIKIAKERIKKADEKYLDPLRFKIQPIEEYYQEVGIKQDPNGPEESYTGEYPDLFGIKLKKHEKDDITCITPGLESHSSVKLYASLLTANMKIKEIEEKKYKEFEADINDIEEDANTKE